VEALTDLVDEDGGAATERAMAQWQSTWACFVHGTLASAPAGKGVVLPRKDLQ
jgi:hypothetical protein